MGFALYTKKIEATALFKCIYKKLTCEKINFNITHLKKYSQLGLERSTSVPLFTQYSLANSLSHTGQQLRQLVSIIKREPLQGSCGARATKKMSRRIRPTAFSTSHGGEFVVDDPMEAESYPSASSPRENPFTFRTWEQVAKKRNGNYFRFKVVSYNMLSQYLLENHSHLYRECDPYNLSWDVRSEKLFKEITDLDPDILCFQEVQSSHLETFYERFEQYGYHGIFKPKTGQRVDGCAIYYKRKVFKLEDHLSVEYYQPHMPILNRDNVALMLKLVTRECPTTALVVATTHLLYNPRRTDIRLAQLQVLLAELDRFSYHDEGDKRYFGYYPIVLAGDFNAFPESAVIRLLDTGRVCSFHHRLRSDWRRVAITDNCQHLAVVISRSLGIASKYSTTRLYNSEMVNFAFEAGGFEWPHPPRVPILLDQEVVRRSYMFNGPFLRQSLRFASVYPQIERGHGATTFQHSWITVDYMFYSARNRLRLLDRLRLPSKEECQTLGRLPNDVYGSDHLMLAAHFEMLHYPPPRR